jgi:dipeptidyl aminopeptidase/acylaminoacyl peptidase
MQMVTPLARQEQIPFARFLHVRNAYGPTFSTDGRTVAFISDLTGIPQAWSVAVAGGWPERLTFSEDRVGLVSYQPGSDRLLLAWDRGGDEKHRLEMLERDGSLTPLTQAPDAMHPFGGWSADGRYISYAANERSGGDLDLVVQDVATGEARMVQQATGLRRPGPFSPDGHSVLAVEQRGSFDEDVQQVDLTTGTVRSLAPHSGKARFLSPQWSRDGKTVYVLTDLDDDFLRLCALDVETLQRRPLDDGGADVNTFAPAPDGRSLAYVRNLDGYSQLVILDVTTGKLRSLPDLPTGVICRDAVPAWLDEPTWSPDSRLLAFSLTGPRQTQNIWLLDIQAGALRQLTFATQAGLAPERLAEPARVQYPSFDGRQIPAFLYAPAGAQPDGTHAAVVQIHGGPESQARPGFDPVVQYLVLRGYVVLVPNVRGSTGYGKAYSHLDDVEKRLDSVADADHAARWLAQAGWADGKRIACYGGSYGGFMVLSCLTEYPETWAAGVEFYGIANFISFFQHTASWRRAHRAAEYGNPERDSALLERLSPIHRVGSIRAPLFVFHGANDVRVPIEETEQIVAALRSRAVPVEYLRVEDEGHSISRLSNRLALYPAVANFLDRYLLG